MPIGPHPLGMIRAQDPGRHPLALGDDVVATPGGGTDLGADLGARIGTTERQGQAIGTAEEEVLRGLQDRFQGLQSLQYDARLFRPRSSSIIGKLVHLARAQNPHYDNVNRIKFEQWKTQQMVGVAQAMAVASAQLRQADPAAAAAGEQMAKDRAKRVDEMARISQTQATVAQMEEVLRGSGIQVSEELHNSITARVLNVPTQEDMMKSEMDRRNLTRVLEPGLSDEEVAADPFAKKVRENRLKEESGKKKGVNVEEFMSYPSLHRIYTDQVKASEDDLTIPDYIGSTRNPYDYFGADTPRMVTLPREPEFVHAAARRAVQRFKRIVGSTVGLQYVDTAIERLNLSEVDEDLKLRGEKTLDEQDAETRHLRTIVIKRLQDRAAEVMGGPPRTNP